MGTRVQVPTVISWANRGDARLLEYVKAIRCVDKDAGDPDASGKLGGIDRNRQEIAAVTRTGGKIKLRDGAVIVPHIDMGGSIQALEVHNKVAKQKPWRRYAEAEQLAVAAGGVLNARLPLRILFECLARQRFRTSHQRRNDQLRR